MSDQREELSLWRLDEWVCSHYRRSHFASDDDVFEHLGRCYVDVPGYWEMES